MKKMMIAAAVVAMAGAVVAADGYDFTASVKTTKGKASSQSTTYRVNLGKDDNGFFWWDSANTGIGNNWDNEKEAKAEVAAWVKDAKKSGYDGSDLETFLGSIGYVESTDKDNGNNLFGNKDLRSKKWCYSFSYTVKDMDCYRVAGSRKIKGIVYIDPACCDDAGAATTWEYRNLDDVIFADADQDWAGYITPGILFRFGGIALGKANKVEMAGVAGDTSFDGTKPGTFALAGQGAWDVKNDYLKNISGNIVGVLANPSCGSCCDYNAAASFWACDGSHNEDEQTINSQIDPSSYDWTIDEGTAAFGTWSMKYNKKY